MWLIAWEINLPSHSTQNSKRHKYWGYGAQSKKTCNGYQEWKTYKGHRATENPPMTCFGIASDWLKKFNLPWWQSQLEPFSGFFFSSFFPQGYTSGRCSFWFSHACSSGASLDKSVGKTSIDRIQYLLSVYPLIDAMCQPFKTNKTALIYDATTK